MEVEYPNYDAILRMLIGNVNDYILKDTTE